MLYDFSVQKQKITNGYLWQTGINPHRVTATGAAQRLLNGERAPSIVETLIACIQNAEQRDRNVRVGLYVMRDAAPGTYKSFVENIIRWQDYAELHLQNAKQSVMGITGSASR